MTKQTMSWVGFLIALGAGCDSGSTVTFTPDGARCQVEMVRNADGFAVEMALACNDSGADCYAIESLQCQGETKPAAVPIDLVADGCPGQPYCVERCEDGLEAPGHLWDMPSLLEVEGCNVYEDAP